MVTRAEVQAEIQRRQQTGGITRDMVLAEINRRQQQPKGFFDRVSEDLATREARIQEIRQFEQTPAERGLQEAGQAAGAIFDVTGEVLTEAGRGISAITPEAIKQPIADVAEDVGSAIVDSPVGQLGIKAIQEGAEVYDSFKQRFPRAARNIEAAANVGLAVAPVKTPVRPAKVTPIGRAGEAVTGAGTQQAARIKKQFVDDLVLPKQTPTEIARQAGRTAEEGLLRRRVVELSPAQKDIAGEVAKLPVKRNRSLVHNHNIISKAVDKEARSLEKRLKRLRIAFPRKEFDASLNRATERILANPVMVGNAETTARRLIAEYSKILDDVPMTPAGLLQARRRFDKTVTSFRPTAFDSQTENAFSVVVKELRNTTNDFIDNAAKGVAVKRSLKKQSDLLGAMDNIAPKMASEADNALSRLWQNTTRILPLRGEFNQTLAALVGVGGLGASALFAPFFTKALLAGVGSTAAFRAVTGPQAKRALGALLSNTDEAIRLTKDQALLQQLRLDRALVLEALQATDRLTATTPREENQTVPEEEEGR